MAVENENAQLRKGITFRSSCCVSVSECLSLELVDLKGRVAALEGRLGAPVTDESQKTADEEDFDLFGDEVITMVSVRIPSVFMVQLQNNILYIQGDEEEEKVVPQPKPAKPKSKEKKIISTVIVIV